MTREFFEAEAKKHLITGDLFTYEHPVIPIKTKGRWYGALSQEAMRRGAKLPELEFLGARYIDPYIFVAMWADEDRGRIEDAIFYGAASALQVAGANHLKAVAFPVLGGKGGDRHLAHQVRGIFEAGDSLDAAGYPVPDYVIVTDKSL